MSEEIKTILEEMRFKASIYRDHKKRGLSFNDEEKNCALLLEYIQQKENIIKGLDNTIENLEEVVEHKENIIKELNDKIEDDKMIIEGNFGCIDNLRKDYNLHKNIIKEVREYIEKYDFITGYYENNYDDVNDTYTHYTVKEELSEILDKEK